MKRLLGSDPPACGCAEPAQVSTLLHLRIAGKALAVDRAGVADIGAHLGDLIMEGAQQEELDGRFADVDALQKDGHVRLLDVRTSVLQAMSNRFDTDRLAFLGGAGCIVHRLRRELFVHDFSYLNRCVVVNS
jgi:hypothetical protein